MRDGLVAFRLAIVISTRAGGARWDEGLDGPSFGVMGSFKLNLASPVFHFFKPFYLKWTAFNKGPLLKIDLSTPGSPVYHLHAPCSPETCWCLSCRQDILVVPCSPKHVGLNFFSLFTTDLLLRS